MELLGKRLSPLMRVEGDAVEERRMSLFLGRVRDENEGEM